MDESKHGLAPTAAGVAAQAREWLGKVREQLNTADQIAAALLEEIEDGDDTIRQTMVTALWTRIAAVGSAAQVAELYGRGIGLRLDLERAEAQEEGR